MNFDKKRAISLKHCLTITKQSHPCAFFVFLRQNEIRPVVPRKNAESDHLRKYLKLNCAVDHFSVKDDRPRAGENTCQSAERDFQA